MRGIITENWNSDLSITDIRVDNHNKIPSKQIYIYFVVRSCMFQTSKTIITPSIKMLYKKENKIQTLIYFNVRSFI